GRRSCSKRRWMAREAWLIQKVGTDVGSQRGAFLTFIACFLYYIACYSKARSERIRNEADHQQRLRSRVPPAPDVMGRRSHSAGGQGAGQAGIAEERPGARVWNRPFFEVSGRAGAAGDRR